MKIAIIGSRWFCDYNFFKENIDVKFRSIEWMEGVRITTIITGGARGIDKMAEKYAIENKINCVVHYAEWSKYGKAAGPVRNQKIIDEADEVIAFWDTVSRGTMDALAKAKKAEKTIHSILIKRKKIEK